MFFNIFSETTFSTLSRAETPIPNYMLLLGTLGMKLLFHSAL